MKTISTHGSFEDVLTSAGEPVQALARHMREIILALDPDVVEVPWPQQGIAGYGVGPKKMSEHYCYIGLYQAHVNIGFYHGINLPDPRGLLKGSGKKLRHIKLHNQVDTELPGLRELLAAARAEREQALKGV